MEIHFSHASVLPFLSMVNPISWFAFKALICVATVPDLPILNSEDLLMSTTLLSFGGKKESALWCTGLLWVILRVRLFVVCLSVRRVACACFALCRLRWICLWHCPSRVLPTPGTLSVLWFGFSANVDDYWNASGNKLCCW